VRCARYTPASSDMRPACSCVEAWEHGYIWQYSVIWYSTAQCMIAQHSRAEEKEIDHVRGVDEV
jgi:hypothetical protein